MKINYLQISNILTFKHYTDITAAPKIDFNKDLNILIGPNGSGKSTVVEVINFIFKRVLLKQYNLAYNQYEERAKLLVGDRKRIINPINNVSHTQFRLNANYDSPSEAQKIRIEITLDDIDKSNIAILTAHKEKIDRIIRKYAEQTPVAFTPFHDIYTLDIELNHNDERTFTTVVTPAGGDVGMIYLTQYHFFKQAIILHNLENPTDLIPSLYEPFSLIVGYRNYNAFTPSISLSSPASQQLEDIKNAEYQKSANATESSEPSIFSLVRLRVADVHYGIYEVVGAVESERKANEEEFLGLINKKLELIKIKVKIELVNKRSWNYSFSFLDTAKNKIITDINNLSAGQKAIIHLVFEAYGRGGLNGGLVVIDEPEIHLHYQFQNEYLRIIEEINEEQKCQYILVTHSESLISARTIDKVKRFTIDQNGYVEIKFPILQATQNKLIKILDNTRSTYAFFAKKVILVEGDSDRYFFKSVFSILQPTKNQEIAILDIGGKGNYEIWKDFFESFGLEVFYIGDFDNVFSLKFSGVTLIDRPKKDSAEEDVKQAKLNYLNAVQKTELRGLYDLLVADPNFLTQPQRGPWKRLIDKFINFVKCTNQELVQKVKEIVTDIDTKIEEKYAEKVYILKAGSVEEYTNTPHKDLDALINYSETGLKIWLDADGEKAKEIKLIISQIVA